MVGRVECALLVLLMIFASCSNEPHGLKVTPDVIEKGDTARNTLLVYILAENSLDGYAALDVEEIAEAAPQIPHDCRLFVYVDDRSYPMLTQYFRMTNGDAGNSNHVIFTEDVCSSDTLAMGKVLDYILDGYPTKSLDVVMWSHGNGWLRAPLYAAPQRSIGIDNGENSFSNTITKTIEIEELAALLKRLPTKVGRLMFDACFMQCVESSYALRGAAEWVIASPAEIPGDGALYSTLVPHFFSSDGTVELMDSYIKAYENEFAGAVLSAVRTEAMQHLADVTYSYVIKYFNVDKRREYADVFAYLPGGKYTGTTTYPSYYDINAIMSKYLTADEYAHWREAYDMAVPYTAASPKWYSALRGRAIIYDIYKGGAMSIYMPQHNSRNERFNADFRTTEWYSAAGWREAGW